MGRPLAVATLVLGAASVMVAAGFFAIGWLELILLSFAIAAVGLALGIPALVVTYIQRARMGRRYIGIAVVGLMLCISYLSVGLTAFWEMGCNIAEENGLAVVRTYVDAEYGYYSHQAILAGRGQYAPLSAIVGDPVYGTALASLIRRTGTYVCGDCARIDGKAVTSQEMAFCATPRKYHRYGRKTFVVQADGVVWAKDLGCSRMVDDIPATPAMAGWTRVEVIPNRFEVPAGAKPGARGAIPVGASGSSEPRGQEPRGQSLGVSGASGSGASGS